MAKRNEGKKFEDDIKACIPQDWYSERLKDPAMSFNKKKDDVTRFSPKNKCDFIVFTGILLFDIECKSFKGKSMPYSMIKKHQLEGCLKTSVEKPLRAQGIFILNFRDLNETYVINAFMINAMKESGERKSISIEEARLNGLLIPQTLKRTRYRYDLTVLGVI